MGGLRAAHPAARTLVVPGRRARDRGLPAVRRASSRRTRSCASAYAAHVPGHEVALRDRARHRRRSPRSTCSGSTSCTFCGESRARPATCASTCTSRRPWCIDAAARARRALGRSAASLGLPQVFGDLVRHPRLEQPRATSWRRCWPRAERTTSTHATELRADAASRSAIAALGLRCSRAGSTSRRPELPARLARALRRRSTALLANKYCVDELYDAVIVRPLVRVSDAVLLPRHRRGADRRRRRERRRARRAAVRVERAAPAPVGPRAGLLSRRCSPAPRRSSGTC